MRNDRLAVGFVNGLGNFIFLTAAVKVLRNWGYHDITLITDRDNFHNKRNWDLLNEIYPYAFDYLETAFDESKYDRFFLCAWSRPGLSVSYIQNNNRGVPDIRWHTTGYHEVELYLKMVGASWKDFDGYLFNVADQPELSSPHPRIALAQCSDSGQSVKKSWPYFSELSLKLQELGYSVVLTGYGNELADCVFDEDFRNKTTISEVGKVLSQCDLLVAPSTGLTVVADAVKTPVLLLEGPMFTARAHPLLTDYQIVRSFISCAPCFQTPVWSLCNDALCMKNITVNQVLKKIITYKPIKYKRVFNGFDVEPVSQYSHHNGCRIAYMFACQDRYPLFRDCLTSFKDSKPLQGTLFVLNDSSLDPRLTDFIKNFEIDGIKIEYMVIPFKHARCKGVRTAILYNKLQRMVFDADESFDYVTFVDSDLLFRPGWIQKEIDIYEEVRKHLKVSAITGFGYRNRNDSTTHGCRYGKYCMNPRISGQFLMSFEFMRDVFGLFDENATSADISKFDELAKQDYVGVKISPSVIQHAGTYASSLRTKPGAFVEDFI